MIDTVVSVKLPIGEMLRIKRDVYKRQTPGGATELMELLGKEESLKRINDAIVKLEAALA